jgi:four helix bundle protein
LEVDTHLEIAARLGFISADTHLTLAEQLKEVRKLLNGLMRSLESSC